MVLHFITLGQALLDGVGNLLPSVTTISGVQQFWRLSSRIARPDCPAIIGIDEAQFTNWLRCRWQFGPDLSTITGCIEVGANGCPGMLHIRDINGEETWPVRHGSTRDKPGWSPGLTAIVCHI